jgi:aspartate/methionine/tyrosine aminotransferase
MNTPAGHVSQRLRRTHAFDGAADLGMSGREADIELHLDGASRGLVDTTHFDVARFPPPDWALTSFVRAASRGASAYTGYRGGSEPRARCAGAIADLMGITVHPDRNLVLTPGTQGALFAALSALVDPGDRVALTDPEYLFSERILRFLGATVVRIPLVPGPQGLDPDLGRLAGAASDGGIRLFLTSNPNNPTGAVYSPAAVRGIAELAASHDFLVVVDELYCRLVYDGTPYAHLAGEPGMASRTVTLLGGSKTESLTGYRVGVAVASDEIADAIEQVIAISALRAPAYSQHVLTSWLRDDSEFVRDRVSQLRAIQRSTADRLQRIPGVTVQPGAGTAYLWPDVSALRISSLEVARLLRAEAGVIVSPGYQFGPSGATRFRICYAQDEARWEPALGRMADVLGALAESASRR